MPETNYSNLGVTVPNGFDSPPDIPGAFKGYSDSFGTGQGAGKLLIVQSTGAAAWKAMSGDATIDKEGKLTVGDGAVTSRKLKPTNGQLTCNAPLVLTETYVLIPGLKLEITPAVASILWVHLTFLKTGEGQVSILPFLDAAEVAEVFIVNPGATAGSGMHSCTWRIPLTAALHTIEIRAKRNAVASTIAAAGQTRAPYLLHAS